MSKASFRLPGVLSLLGLLSLACTSGTRWVNESPRQGGGEKGLRLMEPEAEQGTAREGEEPPVGPERATINAPPPELTEGDLPDANGKRPKLKLKGRKRADVKLPLDGQLIGVFRNTYYDFPAEFNYSGPKVTVMDRKCRPIRDVPRDFYNDICVQGSGTLTTGVTVSFSKRDCKCAEVCPRTGQQICFDALDQKEFPWGRGAMGKAITPLRTIAVDSDVIPLGTNVYIPEFDGVRRRPGGAPHDGCFVAEDRGMKVKGKHVDVFSGNPSITAHMNALVASNLGVHVYVGTARCQ